jgi:hypothetical protein
MDADKDSPSLGFWGLLYDSLLRSKIGMSWIMTFCCTFRVICAI